MPAYVIFIRDETIDPAEMETYAALAKEARAADAVLRVFYGPVETLEGAEAEGVVVVEFPDMAAARRWYDSPAYQAAKPHRLKGARYRVLLTEGVPPQA